MNPYGNSNVLDSGDDIYLDPSKLTGYQHQNPQKLVPQHPQPIIQKPQQPIVVQQQKPVQPIQVQAQKPVQAQPQGGAQHIITWHDPNINSPENTAAVNFLKQLATVKTFTEYTDAAAFLKQEAYATLYVITAGRNGELLTKEIKDLPNLHSIYVYCGNVPLHKGWANGYPKVVLVEDNLKRMITALNENILKQKEAESFKIPEIPNGPALLPCFDENEKSKYEDLLKEFKKTIEFNDNGPALQDFLKAMKALSPEANLGSNPEEGYSVNKAVFWEKEESPFGKLMGQCLRSQDQKSMNHARFGAKEVQNAIVENYQKKSWNFTGTLYKLIKISEEDWTRIKQKDSRGKDIVIPDFLRVSKEERVWEEALKKENKMEWVCVSIVVEEKVALNEAGQGLADLKDLSGKDSVGDEMIFAPFSKFELQRHCTEDIGDEELRGLILKYNPGSGAAVEKQNPKMRHNKKPEAVMEAKSEEIVEAKPEVIEPKIEEKIEKIEEKNEEVKENLEVSIKKNQGPKQLKCKKCNSTVFMTPEHETEVILCDSCMQMSNKSDSSLNQSKGLKVDEEIADKLFEDENEKKPPVAAVVSEQQQKRQEKSANVDVPVVQKQEEVPVVAVVSEQQQKRLEKSANIEAQKEEIPVVEPLNKKAVSVPAEKKEEEKVEGESPAVKAKVNKTLKNADMYLKVKEYELAEGLYHEYLQKNESGSADRKVKALNGLAACWTGKKDDEKTLEFYLKALEVAKESFGMKHAVTREIYGNLANVCNKLASS